MFDDALHSALALLYPPPTWGRVCPSCRRPGRGWCWGPASTDLRPPPPPASVWTRSASSSSSSSSFTRCFEKVSQFQIADIYYHWVWVESVHMNPAMSSLPNFVFGQSFEYCIPSILCNISQHISNILLLWIIFLSLVAESGEYWYIDPMWIHQNR